MAHPLKLLLCYLQGQAWYVRLLLFTWIFALYTEIPLSLGGGKAIPSFTLIPLTVFIWPLIYKNIRIKHLVFGIYIIGIAIASAIPNIGSLGLPTLAVRLAQYAYSVIMAIITLQLVLSVSLKNLEFVFRFLLFFIVIGVLLERIGILSPITQAFRTIYEGTAFGGEINIFREEELAGFIRPIFFTTEPSLVGMGFVMISSCVILISQNLYLDLLMPILHITMIVTLASPTILLATLIWAIVMIVKYKLKISSTILVLMIMTLIVYFINQTPIIGEITDSIVKRFSEELLEEGTSIYSRIYLPFAKTMPVVIQNYPVLGVGYSNHNAISALFGFPGELDPWESQLIIGTNAFVNFINYTGIVGFLVVILSLIWLAKKHDIKHIGLLLAFWAILGQTIGTFSTPRFWCFVMLYFGCLVWFSKQLSSNVQNLQVKDNI